MQTHLATQPLAAQNPGKLSVEGLPRRSFLKSAAILTTIAPFGGTAAFALAEEDSYQLSNAVVNRAMSDMVNLRNKALAGTLTEADAYSAATSLDILFEHFEETGVNTRLQQEYADRREELVNFVPLWADIERLTQELNERGAEISAEEVQDLLTMTQESRQEVLQSIDQVGVRGVEDLLVYAVEDVAVSTTPPPGDEHLILEGRFPSGRIVPASCRSGIGRARIVRTSFQGDDLLCDFLALLAALYGAGCIPIFVFCVAAVIFAIAAALCYLVT